LTSAEERWRKKPLLLLYAKQIKSSALLPSAHLTTTTSATIPILIRSQARVGGRRRGKFFPLFSLLRSDYDGKARTKKPFSGARFPTTPPLSSPVYVWCMLTGLGCASGATPPPSSASSREPPTFSLY